MAASVLFYLWYVLVIRNAPSKSISTHCDKWNFPWINQRNNSLKCCSRKNSLHFPGCDLVNYVPDQLLLLLFKTYTEVLFVDFCLIYWIPSTLFKPTFLFIIKNFPSYRLFKLDMTYFEVQNGQVKWSTSKFKKK